MTAAHTPGPWFTSPDSSTGAFVVARKRNAPPAWHPYETMRDAQGREARFPSEADALAAIAKATGSAS